MRTENHDDAHRVIAVSRARGLTISIHTQPSAFTKDPDGFLCIDGWSEFGSSVQIQRFFIRVRRIEDDAVEGLVLEGKLMRIGDDIGFKGGIEIHSHSDLCSPSKGMQDLLWIAEELDEVLLEEPREPPLVLTDGRARERPHDR